jgi:hypothetical protein
VTYLRTPDPLEIPLKRDLMKQIVETPYMRLVLEKNLLRCKYLDGVKIDLPIAKTCVAERLKLVAGKSYPCLVDMTGIMTATKEAREYFANEGSELVAAGALIVKSPFSRTLGNIFLTINQPKTPVKLFTDETAALNWLEQFMEKEAQTPTSK